MLNSTICLIVLVLALSGQPLIAQEQKPGEFNGWEFLEWKSEKPAVENILKNKGIEIQETYSEQAFDKITRFHYNDLYTWLYFDSLNRLASIEQYKEFSVIQDKEADDFYEKTEKSLIQKFGKPGLQTNDTIIKIINMVWNLKFTEVHLAYDYKYKIIDEFGCCSYKVEIRFDPLEQTEK